MLSTFYRLTKSKFIRGLQCPKALYLDVYHPERGQYPGEVLARFREGRGFEATIKETFAPGIDVIEQSKRNISKALELTYNLLSESNEVVLYEAAFVYNEVLVLADVVRKRADNRLEVFEIKNASGLKPVLRNDVYVQHYVIANAVAEWNARHMEPTLSLTNFALVHNDGNGNGVYCELLDEAQKAMEWVACELNKQKQVLQGVEPAIAIGEQCESPYACPYQHYCCNGTVGQQDINFGE